MYSSEQNVENAAFRLFSGQSDEDPFQIFAQMRAKGAVIPIQFPMGGTKRRTWMVTRMEEAVEVLRDHSRFTVDPSTIEGSTETRYSLTGNEDPSAPPTFFTSKTMLSVDEPDHRRLRGLVSKAFTPGYMESLRPRVQELADVLLDRVQAQGEMDLVKDYAFPLPINVICEMLGVPREDRERLQGWSSAIAHGLGLGKRDPEAVANIRAFGEYNAQLVAEKRRNPADDLISQLIAIEEEGDRLDEAELLSMISLLIFAGHETTSNLHGGGAALCPARHGTRRAADQERGYDPPRFEIRESR
ncbi:cytochrome P450 [Tumebacillus flagellatus]|uniref:cytochrome P450 n=1 Tax=Tumebacillus flagellatus TaxID=1157490 RepID=UPI000A896E52|nr:cytochrome P450 [Tumebacillus flagellatus]